MSSIRESIAFESGNGSCEMRLLAKDGIYLDDAPRDSELLSVSLHASTLNLLTSEILSFSLHGHSSSW